MPKSSKHLALLWVTLGVAVGGACGAANATPITGGFDVHAYLDANGDGAQDDGESGLAGITITLETGTGALVNTISTDANGNAEFTELNTPDLTVGDSYQVFATTPVGDLVTESSNIGVVNEISSDTTVVDATIGYYVPTVPAPAPEPASLAIFASGLLGLGFLLRKRA